MDSENQLTRHIKQLDSKCWDLITIPFNFHEISSNTFLTPNKKFEISLKRRGYYIVNRKSRRVIFNTIINPLSFSEIQAQITNLSRKKS